MESLDKNKKTQSNPVTFSSICICSIDLAHQTKCRAWIRIMVQALQLHFFEQKLGQNIVIRIECSFKIKNI